jgi:hypothetical protein
MTLYTTPDGLPVLEAGDPLAPLDEHLEDLSTATQAALLRPGVVASAAARDIAIPSPVAGQTVWRSDVNWREMYLTTPSVQANGWYPVEGATPYISLRRSAAQTQSAAGWFLVNAAWGSSPVSTRGGFTYSAGVVTVPIAGRYRMDVNVTHSSAGSATNRGMQVTKNSGSVDGAYPATLLKCETVGNTTGGVGGTDEVTLVAGDTLRVFGLTSTASSGVGVGGFDTWFTCQYLSPA